MKELQTKPTMRQRTQYNPHSCTECRRRKIKCGGGKVICSPCEISGRTCVWGQQTAPKPISKTYVDALKAHIKALERELEEAKKQIASHKQAQEWASERLSLSVTLWHDRTSDPDPFAYAPPTVVDPVEVDSHEALKLDEGFIEFFDQLIVEDNGLRRYAPNSIFGMAPKKVDPVTTSTNAGYLSAETYVLLVDGVDENWCNPAFDFNRYLPPEVVLCRREHDRLLHLLFQHTTGWCLRIVPFLFLRDMCRALRSPRSQKPIKTPHYSPMLHNTLLALATALSDNPYLKEWETRQQFARQAKTYIDAECERPSVSAVHALALLGSYHSCHGERSLGYAYFGMSGRMTQALGLSVDCSEWVKAGKVSRESMLNRNWAYWTTFSMDVAWCLFVGRDFTVSLSSDEPEIPIPEMMTGHQEILWNELPSAANSQSNDSSPIFVASCQLFKIGRRIAEFLTCLAKPSCRKESTTESISRIDLDLQEWKISLSEDLDLTSSSRTSSTSNRLMLHLTFWWLQILVHRSFYRQIPATSDSARAIDHAKICTRAADNIMDILRTWDRLYTLRYCPTQLPQIVFFAGTIYILSAGRAESGPRIAHNAREKALAQVDLCLRYLSDIGASWTYAFSVKKILAAVLQEQVHSHSFSRMSAPPRSALNPEFSSTLSPSNNSPGSLALTRYTQPFTTSIPATVLPIGWVWNIADHRTEGTVSLSDNESSLPLAPAFPFHNVGDNITAQVSQPNIPFMNTDHSIAPGMPEQTHSQNPSVPMAGGNDAEFWATQGFPSYNFF